MIATTAAIDGAISEVRVELCRLAPTTPWEDATHRVAALEFLFVRVETNDGRQGTGLSYTVGVGATAVRSLILDYCRSLLIGMPTSHPEPVIRMLRKHLTRTGSGGINTLAMAAVDTAIWDLLAASAGQSVAAYLGGTRRELPAYASSIDLAMTADELAVDVQERLDRGYRAVKIKVGRPSLREDLDRISAAREVLGDDRELYLDANQSWRLDEALVRVRAFEPYRPGWVEEPLNSDDIQGHAELRRRTSVPIAVGESLYSAAQFHQYLLADAVDILQPDVARVGGYSEWLRIAHLAQVWSKPVSAHFLAELSVHVMCAVDNALVLEDVRGGSLHELGLSTLATVRDGVGRVPDAPGIGLCLVEAAVAASQVDVESLRAQSTLSAKLASNA